MISSRILGLVLLFVVVGACATSRSPADDGTRIVVTGEPIGSSARFQGTDRYAYILADSICLTKPGSVALIDVQPLKVVGDLEVTDFLLSAAEGTALLDSGRLDDEIVSTGAVVLSKVCASASEAAEGVPTGGVPLYLEVRKPRSVSASASGFRVRYEVDGDQRSVTINYFLRMCEEPASDPRCTSDPDRFPG